jgi:hypothetical protein
MAWRLSFSVVYYNSVIQIIVFRLILFAHLPDRRTFGAFLFGCKLALFNPGISLSPNVACFTWVRRLYSGRSSDEIRRLFISFVLAIFGV